MNEGEPFIRFDWILDNLDEIGQRLGEHALMVVAAVSIGFVVSFGLALIARRFPATYGPIIAVTGTLYAVPSLALFVLLIPVTGSRWQPGSWRSCCYTLLILVRNIVTAPRGRATPTSSRPPPGWGTRRRSASGGLSSRSPCRW